jgi:hypothetical protein
MNNGLNPISKFPFMENDYIIDLDKMLERLEALSQEVQAYRESLLRHIQARNDLLQKSPLKQNDDKNIPQLLEIKMELDEEFRQRFRLKDEIGQRSTVIGYGVKLLQFHSGR